MKSYRVNKFWLIYFFIRLFYLAFAVYIYSKISTLGDTGRYLNAGICFSWDIFYNSTSLMNFLGGAMGGVFGGNNIFSNFPFMLFSFFTVRWAVEVLELKKFVPRPILFILISLPNFCIWTSICSKEIFGLFFSAVIGVLIIKFLNSDYNFKKRDFLAFYFCIIFKPQYMAFIIQGLLYIYIANKVVSKKVWWQFFVGLLFVICNIFILYLLNNVINMYASGMYSHFALDEAESTRDNVFIHDNDFFKKAPVGMFLAFWGPTFHEMTSKITHLLAGIESLLIVSSCLYLAHNYITRIVKGRLNCVISFSYFIIFSGISLLHYPFGIFNPGSAIRYRTNFLFLFIILLMYLYVYYSPKKSNKYSIDA